MQKLQKQLTSTRLSEMTSPVGQRISKLTLHSRIDYQQLMIQMPTTAQHRFGPQRNRLFYNSTRQETGTTFPVDIHGKQVNALYDKGAGCSLINYSMFEMLGTDLDKGYQPLAKSSRGADMGALGQIT